MVIVCPMGLVWGLRDIISTLNKSSGEVVYDDPSSADNSWLICRFQFCIPSFSPFFACMWRGWSKMTFGNSPICFVFSVLNFLLKNKIASSWGKQNSGDSLEGSILEKRNWNVINSPSTGKALAGLQKQKTALCHPGKSGHQKVQNVNMLRSGPCWSHVGENLWLTTTEETLGLTKVKRGVLGRVESDIKSSPLHFAPWMGGCFQPC